MTTYKTLIEQVGASVPAHLEEQAAPHVFTGAENDGFTRQGDVYVRCESHKPPSINGKPCAKGVVVVRGESDRKSHTLIGDGLFYECSPVDSLTDYGLLVVPDSGVCFLVHDDEHGASGFGPGVWRLWAQVEQVEELRRAAD